MPLLIFILALLCAAQSYAMPMKGVITEGKGEIIHAQSQTHIHQHSKFLATQWQHFNIPRNHQLIAHQKPNMRLLIRVLKTPSHIAGTIIANGTIIIENAAGIQFARGAVVNVGGLIATAAHGTIANLGTIRAGRGGVQLAARHVRAGHITAEGRVSIGRTITATHIRNVGGEVVLSDESEKSDIAISKPNQNLDISLARAIKNKFTIDENGLLDMSGYRLALTLPRGRFGRIILPDNLSHIKADHIELAAAGVVGGVQALGRAPPLIIESINGHITLNANIEFGIPIRVYNREYNNVALHIISAGRLDIATERAVNLRASSVRLKAAEPPRAGAHHISITAFRSAFDIQTNIHTQGDLHIFVEGGVDYHVSGKGAWRANHIIISRRNGDFPKTFPARLEPKTGLIIRSHAPEHSTARSWMAVKEKNILFDVGNPYTGGRLRFVSDFDLCSKKQCGDLTIQPRYGVGAPQFVNNPTLRAKDISFIGLKDFAATARVRLDYQGALTLSSGNSDQGNAFGWMVKQDKPLILSGSGTLNLAGDFNAGSGDISISTRALNLKGAQVAFDGNHIRFHPRYAHSISADLSLNAKGALEIGGHIHIGTGDLAMHSGAAAIIFRSPLLQIEAGAVRLSQAAPFAKDAPAAISRKRALTIKTASAAGTHNRRLDVRFRQRHATSSRPAISPFTTALIWVRARSL